MEELKEISIIIPTFNEAENIGALFERIAASLANYDYEVIIVDDNSPDNTSKVAVQEAKRLDIEKNVRVIVRNNERGLSTAVLRGMNEAKGKVLVVMDADLQHPPEKIPDLYRKIAIENYKIVIATRMGKNGYKNMPTYRRLISKIAGGLAKLLLPKLKNVSDPMSGFFALKREVYLETKDKLNPKGYKILLEIIVKSHVKQNDIGEIEYVFEKRYAGKSKLGLKEYINYILHLLSLNEYRILKFMLVGLSGTAVNEAALWIFHNIFHLPLYISGAFSIELSIINNFILNSIYTFKSSEKSITFKKFFRYHISSAIGISINYVILLFLSTILKVEPLISNLVGIIFGFVANYLLSEHYVWKIEDSGLNSQFSKRRVPV
ncbi:glycosyltransferase [Fervidicoccus fontis]|uniref:Dolichol monophosphate mannose synthase n=1 Tax=Fervidicoccus fontis TaxID=683846 RepID=A0A2J6N2K7_9CREN|nr:glycosyltransferase family 2 protein [Fervidicoccus fontis]PMB75540.1 MAG: dolichol monophosphate mannose synthase [Fervidicoccus fontis]HEW64478.1 glycosyltransferase family 2 protein [Fervidicoccus fontis]